MKITLTTVATMAMVAAFAAPSMAQNKEHVQMAADLRMVQENQQQLSLAVSQLADAIKALNTRLDDVTNATRKGFADQKIGIDAMGNDVREMKERTNSMNVDLGRLREELDALRGSVTALAQANAAAATPVDPGLGAGGPAPTTAPSSTSTIGLSPDRMYELAFGDYSSGAWNAAIAGFQQFISAFGSRSDRADDAQFYIGEALAYQGKFPEAVTAYNAVVQSYPMGDKVPEALFKRGVAQSRLGQTEEARRSWQLVVDKYPASEAASLAKPQLERLGTAPAQPGR